jgi:Holliday junction resolvase RusA-like endonuclease
MADKIPELDSEPIGKIKKYYFRVSTPPSVNHIYKMGRSGGAHGKPVFYMDHKAMEAKKMLMQEFKAYAINNKCPKFKDTVVMVEMIFYNLRKGRDLNNLYKTLFDSMEAVEIFDNDANIIERPLFKKYNASKESFIELWVYEAAGMPSDEDIWNYFFWIKQPEILADMRAKLVKKREHNED